MFSILAPRKRIPPHGGPYKGVLRYHLALMVPEPADQCGHPRRRRRARTGTEGESLVFDDTCEHEAWNDTDGTRVVLFVDLMRPLRGVARRRSTRPSSRLIGFSPFIQDAKARHDAWEKRFEQARNRAGLTEVPEASGLGGSWSLSASTLDQRVGGLLEERRRVVDHEAQPDQTRAPWAPPARPPGSRTRRASSSSQRQRRTVDTSSRWRSGMVMIALSAGLTGTPRSVSRPTKHGDVGAQPRRHRSGSSRRMRSAASAAATEPGRVRRREDERVGRRA